MSPAPGHVHAGPGRRCGLAALRPARCSLLAAGSTHVLVDAICPVHTYICHGHTRVAPVSTAHSVRRRRPLPPPKQRGGAMDQRHARGEALGAMKQAALAWAGRCSSIICCRSQTTCGSSARHSQPACQPASASQCILHGSLRPPSGSAGLESSADDSS